MSAPPLPLTPSHKGRGDSFVPPPSERGGLSCPLPPCGGGLGWGVKGFTLIELVLIILIAGILFIIAEPDIPGFAIELRAQAEQLAGDIRYTQSISMHRGARYRINFFSTNYTITDLAGTTPVVNPSNNASQMNMQSGITLSVSAGIPSGFLVFDGKGGPYVDTGSTALGSASTITLTRGTETQNIGVYPQTGGVFMGGGV